MTYEYYRRLGPDEKASDVLIAGPVGGKKTIVLVPVTIDQPMLGLATTRQLIEELSARIEMDGMLDYRTVDGEGYVRSGAAVGEAEVLMFNEISTSYTHEEKR